jgi:DNA-binding transcriptional LysR family regulator
MMNLAAVDLNLLVALDALLSEAHVGRAARRIGRSQPAASHALNRLRGLLSDPLLVRVGSRMEPTPRALALREPLAEALQRVQAVLVPNAFEPSRSTRRFSVMMQDHVAHLILPALVERVHATAPRVRLLSLSWHSPRSVRPERLQSIDLLISCAADGIPGFFRQGLFTDTEVTVVRSRHPNASRMRNLKTFLEGPHIAVVGRGLKEDPVDTWLRREGLAREIVLRVPSYLQALQAVSQSDLVAFVPKRLAASLAKPLSLALVQPPIDPGKYEEGLFYPRRVRNDPSSIWLRSLVIEIGRQLDPSPVPLRPNRLERTSRALRNF